MAKRFFMPFLRITALMAAAFVFTLAAPGRAAAATVSGDLTKWHLVVVDFAGPNHDEMGTSPNPFLDYRLQVTFTSTASGRSYNVPGFFDGDGNGGGSGNVWRVRFAPDEEGMWTYQASFRAGTDIAVDLDSNAGSATSFDGEGGAFSVAPTDLSAPGFRKYGRLEWDGTHYLKFRDGGYWQKMGTNVPENFLGYAGFDNTPNAQLDYSAHESMWQAGDPSWNSPDGPDTNDARGIIGALNYLAAANVNSIYFLPMNIGADAEDTWPYADPDIDRRGSPSNDNEHFDISKLKQWNIVFDHAQRKSIFLHFVLSDKEVANKNELDNATLGVERKLFYRELVARFGYHNALQWNISEEYNLDLPLHPDVIKEFAGYINAIDPFEHPVTVHNHGNTYVAALGPFVGDDRFDLLSVQTWQRPDDIGDAIEYFREETTAAGRPVPVYVDESIGLDQIGANEYRKRAPWDALLSGGGHELFSRIDWHLNDFTPHDPYFEDAWYARRFVEENLPYWNMIPSDDLVTGENSVHGGAEVLAEEGVIYAIYLPRADSGATLSMAGVSGEFEQHWYNPRNGQFEGPVTIFNASSSHALGSPPSSSSEDWAVLIRRPDDPENIPPIADDATLEVAEDGSAALTLVATDDDLDPLTYIITAQPLHGSLSGTAPNLTYTPDNDYWGADQVVFEANDGRGGSDSATISITILAANDRPTAAPIEASTFEDLPVVLDLDGDDVDGDALSYVVVAAPAHGTLSAPVGNQITYTPAPGYFGPDSFTYAAYDGLLQSVSASATLTIVESTGGNVLFTDDFERPDANALGNGWTELETSSAMVDVRAGQMFFRDSSDQPMRPAVNHSFPGVSQGQLTWTFDMDWTRDRKEGVYALYMQLGQGSSMAARLPNPGTGINLVWSRIDGTHQMLGYRSGSTTTALALVSGPTAVRVDVDFETRTYAVTLNDSLVGENLPLGMVGSLDRIRFVTDGLNEVHFSGRNFDNIMITADSGEIENRDPVAQAETVFLNENTSIGIALTATDADNDPLTYSIVSGPTSGMLTGTAPNVSYTPNTDYIGPDAFTFEVDDGQGGTDQAVIDINVTEVNAWPVASPDSASVDEDGSVGIVLAAGDADGDLLSFSVVSGPAHGSLSGSAPNLSYSPASNYFGADAFTFRVEDGRGGSDQAVISITVDAINDPPVASHGAAGATTGITTPIVLNATDIDSAGLSYEIIAGPSNGSLSSTADGDNQVTYTSNGGFVGGDMFTFVANDGSEPSNIATVTINVTAVPSTIELLSDDFSRSNSAVVGNGWAETEASGAEVEISEGKLLFADTSDLAMRPSATHNFAPVSSGRLTWTFDMDWTRDRKEGSYRVFMQLGSAASMSADSANAGVAVNLLWSRLAGVHQSLGTRSGGTDTAIGVVNGPSTVEVVVDFGSASYEVRVDGALLASGVALSDGAAIDTVRFATDSLNEIYFLGRSFDNVSIVSE